MSELLLDIRELRAWYGPSQALHGINLEVRGGEIVTLLGRNGVGKSTLLKSVMGIVAQRTGSIRLAGRERGVDAAVIGAEGDAGAADLVRRQAHQLTAGQPDRARALRHDA
ncbi:MAG: ATP-binding cassette domain-containing protein, partial [Comamonadaceae bacterium]